MNQNSAANAANISILHPNNALVHANQHHQQQPQQQLQHQHQPQTNLFQPQNLSPHLIKTDNKINTDMNNAPQHVMMIRSSFADNNDLQMIRTQAFASNDANISHIIQTNEISDHIDSVINDVVNVSGVIPTNIEDFEEETNSSFSDGNFLNESEQMPTVKNSKKKNVNKNVS